MKLHIMINAVIIYAVLATGFDLEECFDLVGIFFAFIFCGVL
jgi:hypothetical protein